MEADFSIRKEIDALAGSYDPSLRELLSKYKFDIPSNLSGVGSNSQPLSGNNDSIIGNLVGQLQATLNGFHSRKQEDNTKLDGLNLNVNADILRWIIILLFIAFIIWLVLFRKSKRKNPLNKKLKKIEKDIKELKSLKKGKSRRRRKSLSDTSLEEESETTDSTPTW